MSKHLGHDLRVALIAAIGTAAIVTPTGAVAAAYVANADRVDHKHAVGAGASTASRAGKLVATNSSGRLPNNIIAKAPNAARLDGQTLKQVRTQWLSVTASGTVYGASPGASDVTVTHPATGTYCVSSSNIIRASVSGNVQSQINGFEDLTLVVTSLYNTSACPNNLRIYTTKAGALSDTPFTLTFARQN
jgi:hypothetical protein